ncbi:MAG: response regulator [Chthoniobacteraceae bacterium]
MRAEEAAEPIPEMPRGKRIMVVEDDPGLMSLYRILLHGNGYHVFSAEDGEEAIETFEREGRNFDLMIADVCLPQLGAIEMLTRMKTHGQMPPILICSGAVEFDVEQELRDAGAGWFLPKPFRNREMLGEVARILRMVPTGTS